MTVLGYDAAGIVVEWFLIIFDYIYFWNFFYFNSGSDVKYYKKGDEVFYAGSIIL